MFGRKKDGAKISDKDPVFNGRFIGSIETFVASGKGCTLTPVQHLWDNAGEERHLKKVTIVLSKSGMSLKFVDTKEERVFPIENISFCNADKSVNDRIFCWISRCSKTKTLECHAVLCGSKERAQCMALVLSRAFKIAYIDWKSERNKEERQKILKKQDTNVSYSGGVNQLSKPSDMLDDVDEHAHGRRQSHDSNSSEFTNTNILEAELEEDFQKDCKIKGDQND